MCETRDKNKTRISLTEFFISLTYRVYNHTLMIISFNNMKDLVKLFAECSKIFFGGIYL